MKLLIDNDINLFSYHLPLDAHGEVGNAVQLLIRLNLSVTGRFGFLEGNYVGASSVLEREIPLDVIVSNVMLHIKRDPLVLPFRPKYIKRVAVVTGSGCSFIEEAIHKGFDLFITGEPKEHCWPVAKDEGINVIFAGHYHTEKFGIIALGGVIEEKFGVKFTFIDIEEPI